MKKRNKGITLIALVITIIILLILAGISISALIGSGLFEKAKLAKNRTEEEQELENQMLQEYENQINQLGTTTIIEDINNKPAKTIEEAQNNDMLNKTVNSTLIDKYKNQITIPAGFKIAENAVNVNEGIVIEDSEENQFVWIPVGKVYTKENQTENTSVTITLGRYVFDESGNNYEINYGEYNSDLENLTYGISDLIEEDSTDVSNLKNEGNIIAKNINEFKKSVEDNKGYYIGRYEARTTAKRDYNSEITKLTEKSSDFVYNYINQNEAANLCRNMYNKSKFTSDLINSYAWDTALLFFNKCGNKRKLRLEYQYQ